MFWLRNKKIIFCHELLTNSSQKHICIQTLYGLRYTARFFCMLGNISCFCCPLLTFQNKLFLKLLSVWIQIRTLGPNCLQIISAETKVATSKERVKYKIKKVVRIAKVIGLDKQKNQHTIVNNFLPIIFSICLGFSKEPSH